MLKVTREEFLCMKALVLFSISESAQRRSEIEILQPHFFSFFFNERDELQLLSSGSRAPSTSGGSEEPALL